MKRLLLALAVLCMTSVTSAAPVDRMEPPHWWVGMKAQRLQLMLHGAGLAAAQAELMPYAGVKLVGTQHAQSANYLFVDLDIGSTAQPGDLQLRLQIPGQAAVIQRVPLLAREPGSAQRQGFGPRDAIYLVVPDRFARAGHAEAAGMLEGLDRGNPGGRHGGDIAGLDQHLDYIAALGFTQIWPTPLVENNAPQYSYHGYAATDFYRVDPRFGSNEDYRTLVAHARRKGLGVIQDIVLNHIGSHHWWMADLPSPDWLNQWPQYTETHHARVTLQDPYAAPSDRKRFSDGWFTPNMPDLNQRNPLVATYLTQMTLWWIEQCGLSGIRTDTYSYSDPAFLSAWSARVMAEYPRLNIVGEEWSGHPAIVAYWQRGKRNHDGYVSSTPSMMDFPLHGALLAALSEGDSHNTGFTKLHEALAHDFLYADPAQLVLFDGNHDTPRLFTALHGDPQLTRMALAFLATTRRIPQFFYGTELLLQSPAERDDGRVRADFPGGWAGDPVNAFTGQGLTPQQREMQDWVRRLFTWRKDARLVHEGQLMQYAPLEGCYVFFRYDRQQRRLMVVLNKNTTPTTLDTRRFTEMIRPGDHGRDVLSGQTYEVGRSLQVPGRSALILEIQP